jgi:hypothetical protein
MVIVVNSISMQINEQIDNADLTIVAALHWIYKRGWKSSHPIPEFAKAFESWGDFFYGCLLLCKEIHGLKSLVERGF